MILHKLNYVVSFLVLMLFPVLLFGQAKMQDVVYLKDGSILRGEIIEQTSNESLKIEIAGYNILVIQMEEVEKITQERPPKARMFKEEGYVNFTGLDYLPGELGSAIRFQMVNGYQIDPNFSMGIGIGYTNYNDPLSAIPLFLDLKYKLLKANTTPFLYLKPGYSFSLLMNESGETNNRNEIESHKGGRTINAGIGLNFIVNENIGWYFSLGYSRDNLSYKEMQNIRTVETEITYSRVMFGFGLTF